MFDRLRSWINYDGNQNMKNSTADKSTVEFSKLRKQIELIGIEVKDLNEQAEPVRFQLKTKIINQHFISEFSSTLERLGLVDLSYY
ncbi:MAG: hypothetical protein WBZ36_23370 [Candidatus Nitrosopolaris sp.]